MNLLPTDGESELKVTVPPNQSSRTAKFLALKLSSLFVEPQGQRLITVLSLHKLIHIPRHHKPPAHSMGSNTYSIMPRTWSFMSHLLIITPQ